MRSPVSAMRSLHRDAAAEFFDALDGLGRGVVESGKDDAMARKRSDGMNLFEHIEQLPRRAVLRRLQMKIVAFLGEKPRRTAKFFLCLGSILMLFESAVMSSSAIPSN